MYAMVCYLTIYSMLGSYSDFNLHTVVVFSEAVSENGNLEELFKQFASLMPLRGYKLLQVTFMKTLYLMYACSLYVTIVFLTFC